MSRNNEDVMNNDSEDFDLFATPEEDNLKEELAKGNYRWTNKYTSILAGLLLVVAAASGGAWYGHRTPANSVSSNFASLRASFGGGSGAAGAGVTGGAVGSGFPGGGFGGGNAGTITKISGTTIVILKTDGTSVTVNAAADTPVVQSIPSDLSSLKVGDTISVTGPAEADGSISPFAITKTPTVAGQSSGTTAATTSSNSTGAKPAASAQATKKAQTLAPNSATSTRPSISGGARGGGRFSNPEFTACLTKAGVTFAAGTRPDMTDPKVAEALTKCRALLPNAGGANGFAGRGAGATPTASPAAS
jgi:hypothetical protein